ncbi:MAG: hypothetical protein ACOZQL_39110 [Myxococcota bacterium]
MRFVSWFVVSFALAACSPAVPCRQDAECKYGDVCQSGFCEPEQDRDGGADGGRDGGTDGGTDAGTDAGIRCTPGVECRAKAGDCDVAELCGDDGLCPEDGWVSSGVMCRPAAGPCDLEERCSGLSPQCALDAFLDAREVCRPAVNGCDVEERCSGTGAECPADGFAAATVECAGQVCAAGSVTPARHCAGDAAVCQATTSIPCNGYQCGGAACRTSCASNADCLSTHWCQPGNQCAPRRPDGAACSGAGSTDECMSGTCAAAWVDADGDGIGAGAAVLLCGALPPEGYSARGGDCCDSDPWAKPGATQFKSTPRAGCGGYDYDCNGVEERHDTRTDACQTTGACSTEDRECDGTTGWAGSTAPGCGESASYVTLCRAVSACSTFTCASCSACQPSSVIFTQSCR